VASGLAAGWAASGAAGWAERRAERGEPGVGRTAGPRGDYLYMYVCMFNRL
jgi:hypothetical protein